MSDGGSEMVKDGKMIDYGAETPKDRALREWFDDQEKRNLDRLEDGAKTITQLVTGLYGVLFAVLALKDHPTYLQRPVVQWLGLLGVVAFFASLLAALVTVYPWRTRYQEDNVDEMAQAYQGILHRKSNSLSVALGAFVVSTGLLGAVIVAVLWAGDCQAGWLPGLMVARWEHEGGISTSYYEGCPISTRTLISSSTSGQCTAVRAGHNSHRAR